MEVCHCGQCRKRSGGAFVTAGCDGVTMADASALGVHGPSDDGERLSCRVCGSSAVRRMRDGSAHQIALQALGDLSGIVFDTDLFIDETPPLQAFANETRTVTGAEFIAAMTGEGA